MNSSEQCPYLKGDVIQCHQLVALPIVRTAIGYDELSLKAVREDLCQAPNEDREKLCPALKDLLVAGKTSQYARPVTNTR